MIFVGVLLGDQKLRRSDEVIKNILLLIEHAGAMPVLAELCATTKICNRKHPTLLEPQIPISHEVGRQAQVKPAISREQSRILAIEREPLLVDDEHRHAGAVFGVEPELFDLVLCRIN